MRRMAWCIVVGGLLINGVSIGFSDDSAPGAQASPAPAQPAPQVYRRRGRPQSADRPERPNYSNLFRRSEKRSEVNPFEANSDAKAGVSESAPPMPASAEKSASSRKGNVSFSRRPRKVLATESLSDEVIHAEYENQPNLPGSPEVQQVTNDLPEESGSETSPLFDGPVDGAPMSSSIELPVPVTAPTYAETRQADALPSDGAVGTQIASPIENGPQSPAIQVEGVNKSDGHVGQEVTCQLVATHTASADPKPAHTEDYLSWTLAGLAAGESESIAITMLPLSAEEITTQAEVRFSSAVSGRFDVSQPMLAVNLNFFPASP